MAGAAHHGEGHTGELVAQERPDFFGEETVGGDIGEVAEAADEEQALARGFGRGAEAVEVHAVGNHGTGNADHFGVLFRHHDDLGEAAQRASFEAAPAEGIPRGGERSLAARDLGEEVEGDVVLHQDVAGVFGELGVLDLECLEAEGAYAPRRRAWRMAGERNSWTSGGSRVLQRGSR